MFIESNDENVYDMTICQVFSYLIRKASVVTNCTEKPLQNHFKALSPSVIATTTNKNKTYINRPKNMQVLK